MVQPRKKNGRRKINEERDGVKEQEEDREADGRNKYQKNPQLEAEDPGLEIMEENHKGGKDEQSNEGKREDSSQIKSSRARTERLLSHQ